MGSKRIAAFDILNITACIAVVFLHQNGAVHHFKECTGWYIALFFECICYFAVPVFFMLSGASLMRFDERYGTKEFFKKRLRRTLIPFIIWSFIWMLLLIVNGNIKIQDITPLLIFNGIINTQFQPIYWFFIPLFMIYLLMPLFALCKDNKNLIQYLIILFFVVSSCYPLICKIYNIDINHFIAISIFGPLLYVLCGYYLFRWSLDNKSFYFVLFLGLLSILIRYYFTVKLSIPNGNTNRLLFGYYLPTAVFPSLSVYLLIIRSKFEIKNSTKIILSKLASLSLGIYLLHKLVISAELRLYYRYNITEYSIIWLVIMPFVTYSLCLVIVYFSKKTKIGNIVFP